MDPFDAVRNIKLYTNFMWIGSIAGMIGFIGALIQRRREKEIKIWVWILGAGIVLTVFGLAMALISVQQVYNIT
jgi:hypothetical protein